MGETVQEVGRRFCGIVSETGVNIEDMSAEVVGVGDGILSVDFVCFDVEHSRSSEAAVRLLIGYVKKTKQWARRRRAGRRPAGFSLSPSGNKNRKRILLYFIAFLMWVLFIVFLHFTNGAMSLPLYTYHSTLEITPPPIPV